MIASRAVSNINGTLRMKSKLCAKCGKHPYIIQEALKETVQLYDIYHGNKPDPTKQRIKKAVEERTAIIKQELPKALWD